MGKLKSVLIGCGAIAREHLAALADQKNVEVAAVCDLSATRAEATAERFGVAKWYSSYEEMLTDNKPDLVHITTPPSAHFPIAKTCLTAGLNVFCEKPITVDYQDFTVLRRLAEQNGCMLLENHNVRFHSSIRRIQRLISSGQLGDVLEVQISIYLNVFGADSPYVERNAPHFVLTLRGGIVGDFLTHIAGLVYSLAGPAGDLRTIWEKRIAASPLPADEFRAIIKAERATAFVEFSGNTQPNGFWVRVIGTKMQVETNLFESPRFTMKRFRAGEPALMSLINGIGEAKDVLSGSVGGFWRKLAGTGSYDGLAELISEIYRCLERREPQPISLDEIDSIVRLVDRLTQQELKL